MWGFKIILQGHRNKKDDLWDIYITYEYLHKTWKLFDTHFTDAYDNLKDTNDLTLEEPPSFNQAYSAEIILNAMQLANETAPPDEDPLRSDVPQDISTLGQSSRTPLIETSNTVNRRDDEILQKLESLTV